MKQDRIYEIWCGMKKRCNNPKSNNYINYGGRGVTYCEKWETFEGFLEDMLESYDDALTLERKDVNGSYCKENCCWVTKSEQSLNKRGYINNKLGIPNMKIISNKGIETLQVRIQDPSSGKRINKWFSLNMYSFPVAVELAKAWIKEKREIFGYKDTHGSAR